MIRPGRSYWRDRAQRRIAELTHDLPADADVKARRKALWGKGYDAHLGTVWGRKMWGQEVCKYLGRHGDPRCVAPAPLIHWPEDIHFPFREQGNA